ncbi:MAG: hypothetical protein ABH827_01590 [bacterium]
MKKHIFFTLALFLGLASHTNHAHSMKKDNGYGSDTNSDTETETTKITTQDIAIDILKKKAIKLSKIAAKLKKLMQNGAKNNLEKETKIQIKIKLLLDKTDFITNTLLNLDVCKTIKNKNNKEIQLLQEKSNKLRNQITKNTFKEIAPQILALTLETNNFICNLLTSETNQEKSSREKYNKTIKIIGITVLVIVGVATIISTGVYLGWWNNPCTTLLEKIRNNSPATGDKVTCFDTCIAQYKDSNCIPEYTAGHLTKPCLIEELCKPDLCILDNNAQITTFDNCIKNKCTPIQIGRNPKRPHDIYYKIKRSNLLPENSSGMRCLEDDRKRCEIYIN